MGQLIRVTPSERKILLACGAAAGMSATFGAPLAAVVLAIELLLFEFSTRALLPLIVASSVAGGMHAALFGDGPLFTVPAHDFSGLGDLWIFALVGVACGLLAVVICKGLFVFEHGFRRLPVPRFWHPVIGAIGFATVGLFVPQALGTGYGTIEDVLSDRLAVGTLLAVLLAKVLAWWIAIASGTSGGTLAPILLMSASFGGVAAALVDTLAPGLGLSPGAVALVAMAATFGACTGAAFTSIVFAFELTQDYAAILPIMLAAVLADLVASALLRENLMTEKLARRGLGVPHGYEPDRLRSTFVREVMSKQVQTLSVSSTVGDARRAVEEGQHSAYPLIDPVGRCVGIVTRGDVLGSDDDGRPVTDVASGDLVTVAPDDVVLTVLERMSDEQVDHLPVVDGERLVGVCTRTDVLRARSRGLEHERPQLGVLSTWTPPWVGRRS